MGSLARRTCSVCLLAPSLSSADLQVEQMTAHSITVHAALHPLPASLAGGSPGKCQPWGRSSGKCQPGERAVASTFSPHPTPFRHFHHSSTQLSPTTKLYPQIPCGAHHSISLPGCYLMGRPLWAGLGGTCLTPTRFSSHFPHPFNFQL